MSPKNHFRADLAMILALIAIGAAGYWFSPQLLPKGDVAATPDPACDLHRQACSATLPGGGRVELAIGPRPIPTMQPLQVDIRVDGLSANKAEIDFAGVGMNMGYNRPQLPQLAPGRFGGNASLPVCVTGAMRWRATVLLETERQRIAIPFLFETSH